MSVESGACGPCGSVAPSGSRCTASVGHVGIGQVAEVHAGDLTDYRRVTRHDGALDLRLGEVEQDEVGAARADDRVRFVECRQVAADERRHVRLVADPIAERGQEPAPVLRPVVVNRLSGLDVDQVAPVSGELARDRDPVVDGVSARMPVGDRNAHGEQANQPPGRAHTGLEHAERETAADRPRRSVRGDR